ncbi:FAD-binding monooxygenase [Penicillium lividum]|nr:FAD-binding monooxygenase [Penicillium lividum]
MVGRTLLSVAIVGGGPGGLGTAIALSQLPFLQVTLYEKNPEPREAGAGISLSTNAWKVLDLLGASDGVKGGSKSNTHQRNGHTGKILSITPHPENSDADSRGAIRARRTRLQTALLDKVPDGLIQFNKKLVSLEDRSNGGVRLVFDDLTDAHADLVVGADGIHSIVRRVLFPDHQLRFTGNTAFRTIVPRSRLAHIPDISSTTAWWWGEAGHVYFSDVDDESESDDPFFEITVRSYKEPEIPGKTVVWGIPATNEKVASRVLYGMQWMWFRKANGGVRYIRWTSITGWDKIALIGDASHPLSGAFGSGATFAMEDAWILARALEYTQYSSHPVKAALETFNVIRSPYYARMYEHLDEMGAKMQKFKEANGDFDDFLQAKIDNFLHGDKDFIYKNDIGKVWEEYEASLPDRA